MFKHYVLIRSQFSCVEVADQINKNITLKTTFFVLFCTRLLWRLSEMLDST